MSTKRRPRSGARRDGPRGFCRGCGAAIFWLTCVKADGTRGGLAPVDRLPSFQGNLDVNVEGGTYSVVPKAEAAEHRERCDAGSRPLLHVNHHVTCTNITYRNRHGRVHVPSADEADAADAWARDSASRVEVPEPRDCTAGLELPIELPAIALPAPGEYLVDPEEAEGDPDDE